MDVNYFIFVDFLIEQHRIWKRSYYQLEEEISACIDLSVPQSRQMRVTSPIEDRVTAE